MFKFFYNNKNFKLIVELSNKYISFQIKEEDVFAYAFERKMKINELIELDKVFKQYYNIEEAYNAMIKILGNQNNSIKEINNSKLVISINIINLDSSYREKNLESFKKKSAKQRYYY